MKALATITAMILFPLITQAGDNGSYLFCKSASGRTEVIYGNVGSGQNPQTVELKIDKASYGAAELDNEVILNEKQNSNGSSVLVFTEADHEGVNWLTLKLGALDENGAGKARILSGLDPRSNKPVSKQIDLSCRTIYNPI